MGRVDILGIGGMARGMRGMVLGRRGSGLVGGGDGGMDAYGRWCSGCIGQVVGWFFWRTARAGYL